MIGIVVFLLKVLEKRTANHIREELSEYGEYCVCFSADGSAIHNS